MVAKVSPLAGRVVDAAALVNVPRLVTAYFAGKPDPAAPAGAAVASRASVSSSVAGQHRRTAAAGDAPAMMLRRGLISAGA